MSERKYTDEEIIKAYECCELNACSCSEGCPYRGTSGARKDEVCFLKARNDVYSLLNRQKAEIERLKAEQMMAEGYADALEERAKAEAIREFAERLKDKARMPIGTLYGKMVYVEDIDNLVAEMTEGK